MIMDTAKNLEAIGAECNGLATRFGRTRPPSSSKPQRQRCFVGRKLHECANLSAAFVGRSLTHEKAASINQTFMYIDLLGSQRWSRNTICDRKRHQANCLRRSITEFCGIDLQGRILGRADRFLGFTLPDQPGFGNIVLGVSDHFQS